MDNGSEEIGEEMIQAMIGIAEKHGLGSADFTKYMVSVAGSVVIGTAGPDKAKDALIASAKGLLSMAVSYDPATNSMRRDG